MTTAIKPATPQDKRVELVRVPGQFDRFDQDLVVATPTCCCCCCCCLVTTFSVLAYSSAMLTAETRKQNDPVERRFWFGFAGFFAPILTSIISSLLFALLHVGSAGLIAGTVAYIAIFTALMIFLTGKASRGSNNPKDVALECLMFSLVAAICFAGEFFSIGFVIFGQICVLFVPWLIANSRGFKGVNKAVAMTHRQNGVPRMRPIPVQSTVKTPTPASEPTVWTSIDHPPSPTGTAASSPLNPPTSPETAKPFPAFPNYIPPANDVPPSTDL